MKSTTRLSGLDLASRRVTQKGRRIAWSVYLLVAVSLLTVWLVAGSVLFSYLFGGWMTIGAIALWLIEDAAEY